MPYSIKPQLPRTSPISKRLSAFQPLHWLGLAALLIGLGLVLVPDVRAWLWQAGTALFGSDDTKRRALVERLGIWGPLALLAGMLLQAVVPLLPATADVVLASLLYGFWWGFAIVYSGTLLGAALGYAVGRRWGSWAVRRLAGESMTCRLEQFAEQRGVQAVVLVRLMPALKAEVMNLVAGAVGMAFWPFMAASALGALPATALVVWLAADPQRLFWGVLGLSLLVGLGALGRLWWHKKRGKSALNEL